jgi:signal transduction histidine kinase
MKIKVLYIDDEQNNLISFKAAFRMHYNVFVAQDVREAIDVLMTHPEIKVIFCDQKMPGMTGVELFEQIKTMFPLPVRVLITGFADMEAVINAINLSHVFRYLKKPWKEEEIFQTVEDAVRYYNAYSMMEINMQELKSAYKELDKFAYSVSHDIRGPIAGILTAIDYLDQADKIEEVRDLLGLMRKSLKQLDEYIIAMHEYYNHHKGQVTVSNISFETLAEETKNIYSVFAGANKIAYETQIVQNEPFKSDVVSIKLIINNLLSNAFKYQRKDEPNKRVKLHIEVKSGLAIITVEDNGIGMEEAVFGKIFDLHYRSDTESQGFGFGLFNMKGALMKLKGQIDVQSKPGIGSTFKVTLSSM